MLLNALAALGHSGIKTVRTFGRAGLMLFNAIIGKPEFRKHAPLLVRQLYNVGVLSMLIIIVSGVFIGMVLGLQGYLVLTTYSAETSLGMLVALSLLRELGPVVAALLFAGRRRKLEGNRRRVLLVRDAECRRLAYGPGELSDKERGVRHYGNMDCVIQRL